jgi:adenosylmethionine-8-amino-7-oxononanoate aminotransferase
MSVPTAVSAQGVRLRDENGKDYLDGSSGVLNVNLGHANPEVLQSISAQLEELTFVHRSQFASRPVRQLTEELLAIAPDGISHVEYTNSGSEANDCALRIALAWQHRRGAAERRLVLAEQPSYHGMTAGALALTGHPGKLDPSVEPLIHNDTVGPQVRPADGALRAGIEQWRAALDQAGDRVAAVLVEPLGGASSGAAAVDEDTLRWLRAEADRQGFLLITDEVMSGFGRTGAWFATDHAGVTPDLLVSGKGLTGGYTTLAVVLVNDRVAAEWDTPIGNTVLGHTMSGNPLSAATSRAVLRYLREHDLPNQAAKLGEELRTRLIELRDRHDVVTEVRGKGLMLGLGLVPDQDSPMATARRLVATAKEHGLVLCPGGIDTTTESVLVAPPLVTALVEIDEMVERLDAALTAMAA